MNIHSSNQYTHYLSGTNFRNAFKAFYLFFVDVYGCTVITGCGRHWYQYVSTCVCVCIRVCICACVLCIFRILPGWQKR